MGATLKALPHYFLNILRKEIVPVIITRPWHAYMLLNDILSVFYIHTYHDSAPSTLLLGSTHVGGFCQSGMFFFIRARFGTFRPDFPDTDPWKPFSSFLHWRSMLDTVGSNLHEKGQRGITLTRNMNSLGLYCYVLILFNTKSHELYKQCNIIMMLSFATDLFKIRH